MNRMFAFAAALLATAVTVSSACVAKDPAGLPFRMEPSGQSDRVQITFNRSDRPQTHTWSSSFRHADLTGFDVAGFRGAALQPINFAIRRDAGQVNCSGQGAGAMARGSCSVTADGQFNAFLESNGISRPSAHETFGLITLDVKRELVSAIAQAKYDARSPDQLMELSAVGITPGYIRALGAQGYRPESLDDLVQLKALNVTPEFVRQVHKGGPLPSPERLVMIRAVGADLRTR